MKYLFKPNQTKWVIAIITLIFVALYALMRVLPSSDCGFLHYEEIVNDNGEIEFCATNSAGFIDLSQLTYPVDLSMEWDAASKLGKLSFEMDGGHFLYPHDLVLTHTKKVHLLFIDESMEDYHHLHPKLEDFNKDYSFSFNPLNGGKYNTYVEVVPKRTRRQLIASGSLDVGGSPSPQKFSRKIEDLEKGLNFELIDVPGEIQKNKDYRFKLEVTDTEGRPVALETIMDAKAHMVAFDANRKGFAHMHPYEETFGARESQLEDLSFIFNVPHQGWYRLFAQVQLNGVPIYGQFDLEVN